jgi:ethanolamine-phosphate cytidylyltransferase
VDEVIPNAPYEITEEFMNTLFNKYNIDYIIHGDDPCLLPDGTDAYALAKKVGRYKQIKRTEGVSSTDIVGKMTTWFSIDTILLGFNSLGGHQCHIFSVYCDLNVGTVFFFHPGRILLTFKQKEAGSMETTTDANQNTGATCDKVKSQLSNFLPTSRRIMQFSNGQV